MKLSIGTAWEETSAFLGKEARLVAPVALATFALPTVLADWAYPAGNAGSGAGWLLLVVLLVVLVGQMTMILLANGWRGSIGEAMGKAARRLPLLIGALLIVFLPIALVATIALGGALVGAGITDPAAVTPAALAKVPGAAWIVFLVLILLIVVGVRMFPASAIAASEDVGPLALLKRSLRLTRGVFWRLLVLVVLLGLVGVILDSAVTMVVGSLATLAAGEPKAFNTSALIVALAGGLVGAVVSTVSAIMAGRVYDQLARPEASVSGA
ncbi:MAG: hypothetical protein ABIR25_07430 [Sphingomicrobium sp.]